MWTDSILYMYVCVCIYIYIYIYIERERERERESIFVLLKNSFAIRVIEQVQVSFSVLNTRCL